MEYEYFTIMFRPTPRSTADVRGCLRFPKGTMYEARNASLLRWAANNRPGNPTLREGESMWLDPITVEDAP